MTKQNYTDVILEEMNHKFDLLLEAAGDLKEQLATKADKEDIQQISRRLSTVERSLEVLLKGHRAFHRRLTLLEVK